MTTKKLFMAASLLATSLNANAGGKPHEPKPEPTPVGQAQEQAQGQEQVQGQAQGQQQGQLQNSSNNNANWNTNRNSASSTANAGAVSGASSISTNDNSNAGNNQSAENSVNLTQTYRQVRQAPGAFADAGITTSSCFHDVRFGVSSPIGGISFGKGRKSKDCFRLQLALQAYARGNNIAGDKLYCSITEVKQALGKDCLALVNQLHKVEGTNTFQSITNGNLLTPQDLAAMEARMNERMDRMMKKQLEK